jgi:hypothetical protein
MPRTVREYHCLLISPSDVEAECTALIDLIVRWNAHIGRGLDARVELVPWESHATPDMSAPAQTVINRQLVDRCEIGIAIFWSRLGTPTAQYASGSVEEIYWLRERGARVLIYFSTKPIPQERLRDDQFVRLQAMREQFESEGLLARYTSTENLREQVMLHLTSDVADLLVNDRPDIAPVPGFRLLGHLDVITSRPPRVQEAIQQFQREGTIGVTAVWAQMSPDEREQCRQWVVRRYPGSAQLPTDEECFVAGVVAESLR